MEKIIYIRLIQDFEKITKYKIHLIVMEIILKIKKIFNIITKKNINNNSIWVLPYMNNISSEKFEKIIKKEIKNLEDNNIFVISKDLKKEGNLKILNKFNIKYCTGNLAKKILVFKVIEYINRLQSTKTNKREITVLVNENTKMNIDIIEKLAIESKMIKIVSEEINNFKKFENSLYNEKGIGIQFSNNYRKSLKSSNFIINLDFNEKEINEYDISDKAVIINTEDKIRIRAKSFNGIIINSYKIKFLKQLNIMKFEDLSDFEELEIYESLIHNFNKNLINENSIKIEGLIGNNGKISEKEFKNISQNP